MLSNRRKRKNMVLRSINIFEGRKLDEFQFTDHFLDRWNERIEGPYITSKEDLREFIRANYNCTDVEHLYRDIYLVGGLYITAKIEANEIVLINTLGEYKDNPVLYNIITSGDYGYVLRNYGKMDLAYAG